MAVIFHEIVCIAILNEIINNKNIIIFPISFLWIAYNYLNIRSNESLYFCISTKQIVKYRRIIYL